jgi:hypothetical protein
VTLHAVQLLIRQALSHDEVPVVSPVRVVVDLLQVLFRVHERSFLCFLNKSMVSATRRVRVSGFFASLMNSTYSLWCVYANERK